MFQIVILIVLFPLIFPVASIIIGVLTDLFLPGAGSILVQLGAFLFTQWWWWFPVGHIVGIAWYFFGG